MNLRKIKNMFKEEIYKEDLKKVVLNGLISIFLYGTFIGGISFLIKEILNIPLSIEYIAIAYIVSSNVAKSYYKGHILYPLLSIVFFIGALIMSNFAYLFVLNKVNISLIFDILLSSVTYTLDLFNPFTQLFKGVFGIFNYLILIYIIYFTFQRSKNNYYY